MGDVIKLREDNPGNGAREVLDRYFHGNEFGKYVDECCAASPIGAGAGLSNADHLLLWLWSEGFKVVPVDTP